MSTAPPPDRETNASPDEVLELGVHRGPDRRRRWLVLVVVVAAGVTVLVVRLSSSHTRSAASASASARPSAVVPTTLQPSTDPPSTEPPRNPCAGIAHCVERSTVPARIAALARARLAPDVVLHVQTFVVAGSGTRPTRLIERDLDATFRSATVAVRVDRGADVTSPLTPDPPGVGSLLLHRRNAGFDVRLQYLAPETVPPMLTDLLTLMTAPQLTST